MTWAQIKAAIGPSSSGSSIVIPGIDGNDGEEEISIPTPGLRGVKGDTGSSGINATSIFLPLDTPDDPEDPVIVRGLPGIPGTAGGAGPTGATGASRFILPDDPDDPFDQIQIPPSTVRDLEYLGGLVLTANAVSTGVLPIKPRDELLILVSVSGYSGADIASFRFNGDAGTNYWSRYINSVAGGVVLTNNQNVSQTLARIFAVGVTTDRSAIVKIINRSADSKIACVCGITSTGAAATAGAIEFGGFEWVNTAAQITSIEMRTAGGVNTLTARSGFMVFGRNYSPSVG